jgi:hypothetical protein
MMARRKRNVSANPAVEETLQAFAGARAAIARIRNDIPDRVLIDDITKDGSTRGDGLVVLNNLVTILADSGRVYAHYEDILLTNRANTSFRLLAIDGRAEPKAGARLANIVACVKHDANPTTGEVEGWEFRLPDSICDQLFAMDGGHAKLPVVTTYARHSIFDHDFRLHGPGYNAENQILVQGLEIIPHVDDRPTPPRARAQTVSEAIDRLPPHLRTVLMDFDFAGVIDVTNVVGTFLMGLLMNHFVVDGHPAIFIRGNQPEIGKSLLAKVIGAIFEGRLVAAVKKSGDEEFDKLLCSILKKRQRMVFLDNLRNKLDSERIEAAITSPTLMCRLLGGNEIGEWPNEVLFVLTSNNAVAGQDLVSRNVVIDLYTAGDPKKRQALRKARKPLKYALEHRAEILRELVEMALRWNEAGRPEGDLNTRFESVSRVVGGILEVNGLPGFASNAEKAAVEMDEGLQRMLELAEEVVANRFNASAIIQAGEDPSAAGLVAGDWVPVCEKLQLIDVNPAKSSPARAKATAVGKVFSRYLDSELHIEVGGRPLLFTMRKREGRSGNKVFYYAEVQPVNEEPVPDEASVNPASRPYDPGAERGGLHTRMPASSNDVPSPPPPDTPPLRKGKKNWLDAAKDIGGHSRTP